MYKNLEFDEIQQNSQSKLANYNILSNIYLLFQGTYDQIMYLGG